MKKLLTAVIALSMAISAFAPCASADGNLEKIIVDVKNRAGIQDEYTDFSNDYTSETNGYTEYHFSWTAKENDKTVGIVYNTDDVITDYYKVSDGDYSDNPSFPKVTPDEAKTESRRFRRMCRPRAIST